MEVERDSPMLSQGLGSRVQTRIESFRIHGFCQVTSIRVKDLAEDGFYHSGCGIKLICEHCKFTICHWLPHEDPRIQHWLAHPDCIMPRKPDLHRFLFAQDKRELTYPANWEGICCFSRSELASAGFCYVGRNHARRDIDLVWCFSCGVRLRKWEPDDKPLDCHSKGCGLAKLLAYGDADEQLTSGYESAEVTSEFGWADDVPTIPPDCWRWQSITNVLNAAAAWTSALELDLLHWELAIYSNVLHIIKLLFESFWESPQCLVELDISLLGGWCTLYSSTCLD